MNINFQKEIFKAYDIRGKYPKEINEKIISEIIFQFAKKFLKPNSKIIIGHDARLSSPAIYQITIKKLKDCKIEKLKIIYGKLMTTPMLYFLTNYLKTDFGIMITASHNPKEYNGLKIVGKNAMPISGKQIWKKIS
ncbi:hypothetical protein HZC33_00895 [Candidatus Wolfebacteria bacterium]|nr:hypothetical protein [Candidatus Wolfebacteria bacterium]